MCLRRPGPAGAGGSGEVPLLLCAFSFFFSFLCFFFFFFFFSFLLFLWPSGPGSAFSSSDLGFFLAEAGEDASRPLSTRWCCGGRPLWGGAWEVPRDANGEDQLRFPGPGNGSAP